MWEINNGKVKLDIKQVNSNFRIVKQDNLTFICPKKNLWDWENDGMKWLRSVIVDEKGYVVSCGFPKFGNYNEFKEDTEKLNKSLESQEQVLFTHKYDGSLCIRSVINGNVILRTRGTIDGNFEYENRTSFKEKFRLVAEEKYPILLNPDWNNDKSLLFEYLSKDDRIVLSYEENDLIFLGAVYHYLKLATWNELKQIANEGNLKLVELFELPNDITTLLEQVKNWEIEGVVARCNDSQTLVKVKSASYLYKHRIKSNMKYNFVVDFIYTSNISNKDQFIQALKDQDIDFETLTEALKLYDMYEEALEKFNSCYKIATDLYVKISWEIEEADISLNDREKKKQYALVACKEDPIVKNLMFALYDNKFTAIEATKKKLIYNKC